MKKQQLGIWLDSQEAFLVHLNGDEPFVQKIESDIDTSEIKGGSGTGGTPWGPQINVSENKGLERLKHAQKNYFEILQKALETADEIYLFGPGEMKKHLSKFLESDKSFKPQILEVATADSMTENQLVAKVKDFFENIGQKG